MLDELEIAVWVRFIDRFSLMESAYGGFEAQQVLTGALWQLFYIAVGTKCICNEE